MHILILAAGASRRMRGRDKLAEPAPTVPLLRQITVEAVSTGAPVTVALPLDAPARTALIRDLPVRLLPVADAAQGMARSLRTGILSMPDDAGWAMILLADLPEIRRAHLDSMIAHAARSPARALRGCAGDGTPGHPVMLARSLWPRLDRLSGDIGARHILSGTEVHHVPLPGRVAVTDLDTPEAWDAWRKTQAQSLPIPISAPKPPG